MKSPSPTYRNGISSTAITAPAAAKAGSTAEPWREKFGAKWPILSLARNMRCAKCGNKDGNVIKIGKIKR